MAVQNDSINPFRTLGSKFKEELESVVAQVLIKHGVKQNSDIVKSLEFTDNNRTDALFLLVNDYYEHLSKGRRPRARKIPIHALIAWVKKNSIASSVSANQVAFRIQQSIYRNGLKGKNFIEEVENSVMDVVELRVADTLAEELSDSLYAAFKIK